MTSTIQFKAICQAGCKALQLTARFRQQYYCISICVDSSDNSHNNDRDFKPTTKVDIAMPHFILRLFPHMTNEAQQTV